MYDLIIIGAGPAGLTAAIYAARAKLNFLILSKETGGLITWASKIDNFPGFFNISGQELIDRIQGHLDWFRIEVKEEQVDKVEHKGQTFAVYSGDFVYESKTVLVCSGSRPRKLEVLGAKEFEGKGIAYCAACDGPLYLNKNIIVVGGGDSAMGTALMLSKLVKSIVIVNNLKELTGTDSGMKAAVLNNEKIKVINNAEVKEIIGEKTITSVKIREAITSRLIPAEGIFVSMGHIRNVEFLNGIAKLNSLNEISVDKSGATSVPGLFAAGDVTDMPGKQAIISCGDGARALLGVINYIQRGGKLEWQNIK